MIAFGLIKKKEEKRINLIGPLLLSVNMQYMQYMQLSPPPNQSNHHNYCHNLTGVIRLYRMFQRLHEHGNTTRLVCMCVCVCPTGDDDVDDAWDPSKV